LPQIGAKIEWAKQKGDTMKAFVGVKELKAMIKKGAVKVIDCRFDLFDPEYGAKAYMENHMEGAFFMDVNKDICGEAKKFGGARPDIYLGL